MFKYDTRSNKFLAKQDLAFIVRAANALMDRTDAIPELDDVDHMDLVQGYRDRIHEIRWDLEDMFAFGNTSGGENRIFDRK